MRHAPCSVSVHFQHSIRHVASLGDSSTRCMQGQAVIINKNWNVVPVVEGAGEVEEGVGSAGQNKTVTWRKLKYGHINVWDRAGISKSYAGVKRH